MKNQKNIWLFISLVVVAGLSRLLPHPPNFTAIGAMALFGGAIINSKVLKYLLPLGALLISDLVLNNTIYSSGEFSLYYPGMIWVYGAFIVIAFVGSKLNNTNVKSILGGSIGSALLFFVVTNFGYWASGVTYPLTLEGFTACYIAA
ncbi:MAG: DUF6580 family putative transport protein, partial [Salibacteraceae bacterium]